LIGNVVDEYVKVTQSASSFSVPSGRSKIRISDEVNGKLYTLTDKELRGFSYVQNGGSKIDRIAYLLTHVPAHKLYEYIETDISEFVDPQLGGEIALMPYSLSSIRKAGATESNMRSGDMSGVLGKAKRVLQRSLDGEGSPYGEMKVPQMLLSNIVSQAAIGVDYRTNPYLRHISWLWAHLGGDCFLENQGFKVVAKKGNVLIGKQVSILVLAAHLWAEARYDRGMLQEVVGYIINKPYQRITELRKHTNLLKMAPLCLAPAGEGEMYKWQYSGEKHNPGIGGYTVVVPTYNDTVWYTKYARDLEEQFSWLKKEGLHRTEKIFRDLMHSAPNHHSLGLTANVLFFEAFCFLPGDSNAEAINTQSAPVPSKDVQMATPLAQEMYKLGKEIFQEVYNQEHKSKLGWMDEKRWRRIVISTLTNRSAGTGTAEFVTVKIKNRPRPLKIGSTSKIMHFYRRPSEFLSKDVMLEKMSADMLTGIFVTSRLTEAKNVRLVYLINLAKHLGQSTYVLPLLDYMSKRDSSDDWRTSANCYVLGKETGSTFANHILGAVATSSEGALWPFSFDFSAFDTTIHYHSARAPFFRGMSDEMLKYNDTMAWPTFGTLGRFIVDLNAAFEEVEAILVDKNEAYAIDVLGYTRRMTQAGEKVIKVLKAHGLMSGEFQTAVLGSLTNKANARVTELEIKKRRTLDRFRDFFMRLLGDDSIKFRELVRPLGYGTAEELRDSVDILSEFIDLHVEVAKGNLLEYNPLKTVARSCYYEFLKKWIIYGYFVGLKGKSDVGLYHGEGAPSFLDPAEKWRSVMDKRRNALIRGQNSRMTYFQGLTICALSRFVRLRRGVAGKTSWFALPIGCIFAPISTGGGGQVPFMFLGPAKDGLISYLCSKDPNYSVIVGAAAHILAVTSTNIRKEASVAASRAPELSEGRKYIEQNVRDNNRVLSSIEALNVQRSRNGGRSLVPPELWYQNLPFATAERAIAGNKKLRELNVMEKVEAGEKFMRRARDNFLPYHKMNRTFKDIEFDGTIFMDDLAHGCPIAALDRPYQNIWKAFGVNEGKSRRSEGMAKARTILLKDRHFPRHIQPETIFRILVRNSAQYDPEEIIRSIVIMGGSHETGESFSTLLGEAAAGWEFFLAAESVETNDQFGAMLALNEADVQKHVDANSIGDQQMDSYLKYAAILYKMYLLERNQGNRRIYIQTGAGAPGSVKSSILNINTVETYTLETMNKVKTRDIPFYRDDAFKTYATGGNKIFD
jgi:hypothetical protein